MHGSRIRKTIYCLFGLGLFVIVLAAAWEFVPEGRGLSEDKRDNSLDSRRAVWKGVLSRLYVAYTAPDGSLYGLEDNFLYRSDDGGKSFRRLGALPERRKDLLSQTQEIIARSKVARHIRRVLGPRNIVVLSTGTIIVFFDRIYRSANGGLSFTEVFDPSQISFPGSFGFGVGVTVAANDTIYAGEYYAAGSNRKPIRIIEGREDGTIWRVIHTFETGEIRHIHSIHYDNFRDVIWICTGDEDPESNIFFTDDGFDSINKLGGGSQDWRVVSLIPTEDSLYWGSDNDRPEGASIFRWSFDRGRLERIRKIGKPAYYSTRLKNGTLVLSTVYEPGSGYVRYNHPQPSTEIWVSQEGDDWTRLLSIPAAYPDNENGGLRAKIAFPYGQPLRDLFVTPVNTAHSHLETHVVQPIF
jgi:hypothetical protein